MNIEEFRAYCLSFKGVYEKMPFSGVADKYSRDVLCFYVADKWFASSISKFSIFVASNANPKNPENYKPDILE